MSLKKKRRPNFLRKQKRLDILHHAVLQKLSQDDFPISLIDIRSSTFAVVSNLLSPLESPKHIVATHTAHSLEVSLPRLRISFFLNTNQELECRSIPGYVVDTSQSCGTMYGLRNKLVLRPRLSGPEGHLMSRRVIIPQGEISFRRDGDFTNVSINTDTEQHTRWYEYTIDTNLQCLTSNSSLSSKLYQCYLHALTSHCLPDPLLGHMGTEEALYILRSAACRSFQRLDIYDQNLLTLISNLSPKIISSPSLTVEVRWNDLPALSQNPDLFYAAGSILGHADALRVLYDPPSVRNTAYRNQKLLNRMASHNKSYYPLDLHILGKLSSLRDIQYGSRDVSKTAGNEAFGISWSIWNEQPSVYEELWDVMSSWSSLGPAGRKVSLRYSRYWLELQIRDVARDWIAIYDLCRETAINQGLRNLRIELSFSLSAAVYRGNVDSSIIAFIISFALDARFINLSPPPDGSFIISDGLAPEFTKLCDMVTKSALPISSTPARFLKVEGERVQKINFWGKREYHPTIQREYDIAISRESSAVTEAILHQWPDYKSVDFPVRWINRSECNRRIKEYLKSISRNIRLRGHILQIQSILQRYQDVSIPAAIRYAFIPQFITSRSKAPSYSLQHILASRVNVPIPSAHRELVQLRVIPPTARKQVVPSQAGSDSLDTLIQELQDSPNFLLHIYGNNLNKNHLELLGHNVSQSARGAVPSHELLLLYHKECSHRKDELFSDISAALSPSQKVEETCHIAGLWPRITPRSILRQLSHDRISTLPDQWKCVIKLYAVSYAKYQQSLRLLKLSSKQKYEELTREMESIWDDVLAESTPDWLLVQVSPLPC